MSARILICGHYGGGNQGDEAVLAAILQGLRRRFRRPSVAVISHHPTQTRAIHGVKAIHWLDCGGIVSAMLGGDLFLLGGGTLLTDAYSIGSLRYFTAVTVLARLCGMRTMLYAGGVGPLGTSQSRLLAKAALKALDYIALRDRISAEYVKGLLPRHRNIVLVADPIFSPEQAAPQSAYPINLKKRRYAVIAPCGSIGRNTVDFSALAALGKHLALKHGLKILLLVTDYARDSAQAKQLSEQIGEAAYLPNRILPWRDISADIAGAELVIGMRLHPLMFAAKHSVPFLAIPSSDPKIAGFMRERILRGLILPKEPSRWPTAADSVLANRPALVRSLQALGPSFAKRAYKAPEIAAALCGKWRL